MEIVTMFLLLIMAEMLLLMNKLAIIEVILMSVLTINTVRTTKFDNMRIIYDALRQLQSLKLILISLKIVVQRIRYAWLVIHLQDLQCHRLNTQYLRNFH